MTEVERNWFRRCFAGEDAPPQYYTQRATRTVTSRSTPDDVAGRHDRAWRAEIEHVRPDRSARVTDLGRAVGDVGAMGNQPNMRWILVHMIEEYARHCGHADLLRERIDGVVGD